MEPLTDDELNRLLQRWEVPAAPTTLSVHVQTLPKPSRGSTLSWLWNGRIQIPVPAGALAVAVLAAIWFYSGSEPVTPKTPSIESTVAPQEAPPAPVEPEKAPVIIVNDKPATAALSGFQPVGQLELRIVREQP